MITHGHILGAKMALSDRSWAPQSCFGASQAPSPHTNGILTWRNDAMNLLECVCVIDWWRGKSLYIFGAKMAVKNEILNVYKLADPQNPLSALPM